MSDRAPPCILLVDDNPDDRSLARRALAASFPGMVFIEIGTAADFAAHIGDAFDCVITDYRIGWIDGLQVLKEIRKRYPDMPVIMFTNTGNEEVCVAGMKAGLSDYIVKRKEEFPKLPTAVSNALELTHTRRLVKERDAQLEDLLDRERAAHAEAIKANHLKDEFLATVSHELRTPLSAILGWAHLLQLGRMSREQEKEAFKVIERNARAQTQLVEDLLDMSRIISGTFRIDLSPLDILDTLQTTMAEAAPLAEKKNIPLSTRFDIVPPPIRGDAQRIRQIVGNLLSNAVKFTPEGGTVVVALEHVRSSVRISVTDNGIGIDPAFLPHLFDRFKQGDNGPTRRHGGLGIGLSVARSLVELHGGTIAAYSEGVGKGARFEVTFPVAVMREQEVRSSEKKARDGAGDGKLEGLRIVAVDDDPDTLEIMRRVLTSYGAEVKTSAGAREALEMLHRERFDILLSDIGMPDTDGFTFMEKVRTSGGPNCGIPSASVTAFARGKDRERALLSGYDAHLVKPIEPGELVATVVALDRKRGGESRTREQ